MSMFQIVQLPLYENPSQGTTVLLDMPAYYIKLDSQRNAVGYDRFDKMVFTYPLELGRVLVRKFETHKREYTLTTNPSERQYAYNSYQREYDRAQDTQPEAQQATSTGSCECFVCHSEVVHASDCAVHNAPAMENAPCTCSPENHWLVQIKDTESNLWQTIGGEYLPLTEALEQAMWFRSTCLKTQPECYKPFVRVVDESSLQVVAEWGPDAQATNELPKPKYVLDDSFYTPFTIGEICQQHGITLHEGSEDHPWITVQHYDSPEGRIALESIDEVHTYLLGYQSRAVNGLVTATKDCGAALDAM